MIFDIIDQINDIKLRNLDSHQRPDMEATIGEDGEDAMEKDLEKYLGDATTIASSDMEQPSVELAKPGKESKEPDLVRISKSQNTALQI